MKREICECLIDSFVDYAGKHHNFIICAVSSTPIESLGDKLVIGWEEDAYINTNRFSADVVRMVQIGTSICNPGDIFDAEIGKRIAYNKAINSDPVLFSTKPGLINRGLIQGLLMQEAEFIKSNPGKIIAGYHEAKAKYDKKQAEEAEMKALSPEEMMVVDLANSGVDLAKCARLSKTVTDKQINDLERVK